MFENKDFPENKTKMFFCYSKQLADYLIYKVGLKSIVHGLNIQNKHRFWGFVKGDNLDKALTDWENMRKNGKLDDVLKGKNPNN